MLQFIIHSVWHCLIFLMKNMKSLVLLGQVLLTQNPAVPSILFRKIDVNIDAPFLLKDKLPQSMKEGLFQSVQ